MYATGKVIQSLRDFLGIAKNKLRVVSLFKAFKYKISYNN